MKFNIDLSLVDSILIDKRHKEISFIPKTGKSQTFKYSALNHHKDLQQIVVECNDIIVTFFTETNEICIIPATPFEEGKIVSTFSSFVADERFLLFK